MKIPLILLYFFFVISFNCIAFALKKKDSTLKPSDAEKMLIQSNKGTKKWTKVKLFKSAPPKCVIRPKKTKLFSSSSPKPITHHLFTHMNIEILEQAGTYEEHQVTLLHQQPQQDQKKAKPMIVKMLKCACTRLISQDKLSMPNHQLKTKTNEKNQVMAPDKRNYVKLSDNSSSVSSKENFGNKEEDLFIYRKGHSSSRPTSSNRSNDKESYIKRKGELGLSVPDPYQYPYEQVKNTESLNNSQQAEAKKETSISALALKEQKSHQHASSIMKNGELLEKKGIQSLDYQTHPIGLHKTSSVSHQSKFNKSHSSTYTIRDSLMEVNSEGKLMSESNNSEYFTLLEKSIDSDIHDKNIMLFKNSSTMGRKHNFLDKKVEPVITKTSLEANKVDISASNNDILNKVEDSKTLRSVIVRNNKPARNTKIHSNNFQESRNHKESIRSEGLSSVSISDHQTNKTSSMEAKLINHDITSNRPDRALEGKDQKNLVRGVAQIKDESEKEDISTLFHSDSDGYYTLELQPFKKENNVNENVTSRSSINNDISHHNGGNAQKKSVKFIQHHNLAGPPLDTLRPIQDIMECSYKSSSADSSTVLSNKYQSTLTAEVENYSQAPDVVITNSNVESVSSSSLENVEPRRPLKDDSSMMVGRLSDSHSRHRHTNEVGREEDCGKKDNSVSDGGNIPSTWVQFNEPIIIKGTPLLVSQDSHHSASEEKSYLQGIFDQRDQLTDQEKSKSTTNTEMAEFLLLKGGTTRWTFLFFIIENPSCSIRRGRYLKVEEPIVDKLLTSKNIAISLDPGSYEDHEMEYHYFPGKGNSIIPMLQCTCSISKGSRESMEHSLKNNMRRKHVETFSSAMALPGNLLCIDGKINLSKGLWGDNSFFVYALDPAHKGKYNVVAHLVYV